MAHKINFELHMEMEVGDEAMETDDGLPEYCQKIGDKIAADLEAHIRKQQKKLREKKKRETGDEVQSTPASPVQGFRNVFKFPNKD